MEATVSHSEDTAANSDSAGPSEVSVTTSEEFLALLVELSVEQ